MILLGVALAAMPSKNRASDKKPDGIKYGSIVRLVRDGHTFCSGVVIDNDTILTAGHCVVMETPFGTFMSPEAIEIRQSDNQPLGITGKAKVASGQIDRGILKGDFSKLEKSPYISDTAKNVATHGNSYISCGYPLGLELYCTKMRFGGNSGFFIAVFGKGNLIPGMSGGPTFLEDGTVVAINVAVEGGYSYLAPSNGVDGWK